MTTSRIVRGTKTRIFLCVCGILIITGVIACYNSALTQLEDARKSNEICHQQEENLSTQLQVISDYKQRLEKSLKTEKAEHQQTKTELENKLNEEHTKNEKTKGESDLRFNSLQQHFNLLQTQHDDFKEECSNAQNKQLNEINLLQIKLKEVQDELKNVQSSKESLKTEYLQLQMTKVSLENQLKSNTNDIANNKSQISDLIKANQKLQKELDELKQKCPSGYDSLQPPRSPASEHVDSAAVVAPPRGNFGKLRQLNPDEYEIDKPMAGAQPPSPAESDKLLQQQQQQNGNVADHPPPAVAAPAQEKSVLAVPAAGGSSSSQGSVLIGPSKSTTVSSLNVSQGSLSGARPIGLPTVTPPKQQRSTSKRVPESAGNFLPLPYRNANNNMKVPEGIVRVPGSAQLQGEGEDLKKKEEQQQDNNELPGEAIDDRYRNKIESEMIKEDKKADDTEKENGAHEVFDQPLHNGGAVAAGNAYDMLRFDDVNNNADRPGFNSNNNNNIKVPLDSGLLDARDKDGGGIGGEYKENANDVQLEEHDPDEDDDGDEYGEHLARQKDPAIRN